jgi:hypothetical protein
VTDTSTRPTDAGVWERLRRRKVVQGGFQQGLAYVSTLLDWPVQVQRLTGLALLISLPIALVLAWYHGDRGRCLGHARAAAEGGHSTTLPGLFEPKRAPTVLPAVLGFVKP